MARYDGLIAFLEDEAHALKARIADLAGKDYPQGVTTGDGTPSVWITSRQDAEAKLREIEKHLADLKADPNR